MYENVQGFKYENATQGRKGNAITIGTGEGTCDLATAITSKPIGLLLDEPKQNETGSLGTVRGKVYQAIASAAITYGVVLTATTGGKFVTIGAKATTLTTTLEYTWGFALAAANDADDLIPFLFDPHEMEQ